MYRYLKETEFVYAEIEKNCELYCNRRFLYMTADKYNRIFNQIQLVTASLFNAYSRK